MSKRSQSVKRIKAPIGFQEAVRLLKDVNGMSDKTRALRLKQAAYNITCALPWAERARATASSANSDWLGAAVCELQRAERQLRELTLDGETSRRGWHAKLDALLQTFDDINYLYARGPIGGSSDLPHSDRDFVSEVALDC